MHRTVGAAMQIFNAASSSVAKISNAAQFVLGHHHERPLFFALFTNMGMERRGVSLQVCSVTRDKSPTVSTGHAFTLNEPRKRRVCTKPSTCILWRTVVCYSCCTAKVTCKRTIVNMFKRKEKRVGHPRNVGQKTHVSHSCKCYNASGFQNF